jgi:hypothetical protein
MSYLSTYGVFGILRQLSEALLQLTSGLTPDFKNRFGDFLGFFYTNTAEALSVPTPYRVV